MGQHQSNQNRAKNDEDKQSSHIDNVSTLSLGRKSTTECSSLGERSTATVRQFKRKLKRIELYSLHQVFDELKTEYPDSFECIEAKKFLEHLNLPSSVEQGGILLFKSFSYLGSYPQCTAVPLTFDAFLTAFVLLTGKMDSSDSPESLFEDMFFESLAVVHSKKQEAVEEVVKEAEEEPKNKGLSLADLGVTFDDLDFDVDKKSISTDDTSAMMLCSDLVELFTLMLYIVVSEKKDPGQVDVDPLRSMARNIVSGMQTEQGQERISQRHFFAWKGRNAPLLFKTIQLFIYGKFGLSGQSSLTTVSDIILPEDIVSTPDVSDILTIPYCALLCWCLPDIASRIKEWPRLYSGDKDGFSMNRYESHVFRYPGPTLMLIRGETADTTLILGAYISEPWKQSRQYWGHDDCFVFELWPTFQVYRSTGRNNQYVYYHDDFGIGMGGTSKSSAPPKHSQLPTFLLMLDNTLQQGVYAQERYPALATLDQSMAQNSFDYHFETANIEVFGLGSEKARQVQEREWEFEKREAMRRAGLQFRQADQSVDRELLRMAGIINDEARQER
ncbi:TLD-domain-containing protein [Fennellomyces sp. T-0311]|nr:TLD-domain-containing protein [Fennellomyces sp. T-0311]